LLQEELTIVQQTLPVSPSCLNSLLPNCMNGDVLSMPWLAGQDLRRKFHFLLYFLFFCVTVELRMQEYASLCFVTVLAAVMYCYHSYFVLRARIHFRIPPPAISGPPLFEKVVRVQQETQEQFALLVPLVWIFGVFLSQWLACVVTVVWILSRALFSGLHAQEKLSQNDEYYALWAEKMSTAMPRILVIVLLLWLDLTNNQPPVYYNGKRERK